MTKGKKRGNNEGTVGFYGGRWVACATLQTPKGKKRKAFYGKTRKEAHDKMIEARAAQGGLAFDPDKLSVSEYLNRWLNVSARASVGLSTFERYEQVVRRNLVPAFGSLKLEKLTAAHVEFLKSSLLEEGYAPDTVRHI